MTLKVVVRPNAYYDSVTLMQVSSALAALPGVEAASVVMATELNLRYLEDARLLEPDAARAGVNDLIIAVRASSADQADAAHARAAEILATRRAAGGRLQSRRMRSPMASRCSPPPSPRSSAAASGIAGRMRRASRRAPSWRMSPVCSGIAARNASRPCRRSCRRASRWHASSR